MSFDADAIANIEAILAIVGTTGVAISAAQMNKIADHVHRRHAASIRASSDGDSPIFRSGLGAMSKLTNKVAVDGTDLKTYEEDDSTEFGSQAIGTSPGADPIVSLDTD